MRSIALIVNQIAGRGQAAQFGAELAERLMQAGFVTTSELTPKTAAVVTLGGDGTVRRMLPEILGRKIPLYAAPLGNENLFSREVSHSADLGAIVRALRRGEIEELYLGRVGGQIFSTMVSVGLDSEVVRRVAESRTKPVGTLGYLLPTFRAALGHSPAPITLVVDGAEVVSGELGLLIVANTRQYARGLCPVPEANPREFLLRARFFPTRSAAFYLRLLPSLLTRSPMPLSGSRPFAGERFEIRTAVPFPVQADGDYVGDSPVIVERESLPLSVFLP